MLKRTVFFALTLVFAVGVAPTSWVSKDAGVAYAQKCACKPGCKCDHCTGKSKDCPCPKY